MSFHVGTQLCYVALVLSVSLACKLCDSSLVLSTKEERENRFISIETVSKVIISNHLHENILLYTCMQLFNIVWSMTLGGHEASTCIYTYASITSQWVYIKKSGHTLYTLTWKHCTTRPVVTQVHPRYPFLLWTCPTSYRYIVILALIQKVLNSTMQHCMSLILYIHVHVHCNFSGIMVSHR